MSPQLQTDQTAIDITMLTLPIPHLTILTSCSLIEWAPLQRAMLLGWIEDILAEVRQSLCGLHLENTTSLYEHTMSDDKDFLTLYSMTCCDTDKVSTPALWTSQHPGTPATRQPGNPATRQPGNPAPLKQANCKNHKIWSTRTAF